MLLLTLMFVCFFVFFFKLFYIYFSWNKEIHSQNTISDTHDHPLRLNDIIGNNRLRINHLLSLEIYY